MERCRRDKKDLGVNFMREGMAGEQPDFSAQKHEHAEDNEIRVRGGIPKEKFREVEDYLRGVRSGEIQDGFIEKFEEKELEKTPEILESINLGNDYLRNLKAEAGLKHKDITPDKIHILPAADAEDLGVEGSFHSSIDGHLIVVKSADFEPQIMTAANIFHEMAHESSFQSFQAETKGGRLGVEARRSGLKTLDRKGGVSTAVLDGLNEAITETLTDNFTKEVLAKSDLFTEEVDFSERVIENNGAEKFKLDDEFFGVVVHNEEDGKTYGLQNNYTEHMKLLKYLTTEIASNKPEKYPTPADAMNMFKRSYFRGNLVDLSKSLVSTFGRDAFDMIKRCDDSRESAEDTLSYLKARAQL